MGDLAFDIVGFDLDGTLLDTHEDLAAALNHALALAGRGSLVTGRVRAMIGAGAGALLQRGLDLTGGAVPPDRFAALLQALLDHYAANIAVHTRAFPGCVAMLDALAARGVRCAVVTNKREGLAVRLLDALDMTRRFFTVIGGDTLGPDSGKPAPATLREMVRRGGGGRAAYVGDSSFDTRAARAAGLPCVAVRFGFNDLPPDDLGADAVIDHFDALLPALARL